MKILDIITESHNRCPHCGGPLVSESELMEKKDACYYKIKSSAKVWPSAYASGRLVQCRKKGAANYGNKKKVDERSLNEFAPYDHNDDGEYDDEGDDELRSLYDTKFELEAELDYADEEDREHLESELEDVHARILELKPDAILEQGVAEGSLNEFAPGSGGGESGRWYTDDQITDLVGDGWYQDLDVSGDIPKQQMIQQAQAWLDDQGYSVEVLNCRVNDDDMEWYIEGTFYNPQFAKKEVDEGENWSKHNNKRVGGMSKKSVSSYRRSHPGSKIQTAVTTKPSKLKKGSKSAKRRASFCARMRGMKKHRTGAKTAHDPNSNINKSLRRWHCESIEELHELVMLAEQFIRNKKNEL